MPAATTEENKQIVRRLLDDVVTGGDTDPIDDLFAEDVVDHTLMGDTRCREPIKRRAESLHAGFSDFSATVEKLIAEGDSVALWATDRGTHDGEFMGIEPTGREVEYAATAFFRMEDGKIAERWVQPDLFSLMQQLDVVELPREPAGRGTIETVTSADGTPIAYERSGSGPPIVLVHGGASDHRFWDVSDIRSTLANHFTVYAMDCRGVGESDDAEAYELEREFEDVAAVVDSVDRPVTLLGHSSGALLSLEAALRTDNLQKLVLYEPPIAVGDHQLYSESTLAEMKQLLSAGRNEAVLVLFLQEIAQSTPEEIDAQRSAPDWQDMVDAAHVWLRSVEAIGEYEFDAARFENMTTSTLLLSGSESPSFLRDATEVVHDALPDSRLVTFDGHAHEAMLTAPDRFVDEVSSFIRESK